MSGGYFKNKTILKLLDRYKDLWALSYASGVAHWDLETYMPVKGALARGEALGRISVIRQKLFLDPSFIKLLISVKNARNLTDQEKGVVRMLLREYKYYQKVPAQFVEEFEKLTNTATVIWRQAKEKGDYKIFEKSLSKIFDMNKKLAEYLGYQNSPYDALLDQFEEGLTSGEVSNFFDEVKDPLKNLLTKITHSDNYKKDHVLEDTAYNKLKLESLNQKILKLFWSDFDRFRLDTSSHPFTTSFSSGDTRITTWYHQKDFARSVLATIHEFGHALYDLQCDTDLEMTPIQGGSSLVIHESQSRFWENFVGRSEEFIKYFKKDFDSAIGRTVPVGVYYQYFNKVSPGPLRVEADEVTYHFHIMLRYEIEKGIVEGSIKTKDLREVWNTKMKEYLGILPKNDAEGILQDIHWSGGMVGYFPTYSLGTFLGAQWEQKINSSLKGVNDYEKIKKLLYRFIHRYGSTYTLNKLLKKNKMKFDPSVNIKYLEEKYSEIYNN